MKKLALFAALAITLCTAGVQEAEARSSLKTIYNKARDAYKSLRSPSYVYTPNPYQANTGVVGQFFGNDLNYNYYPQNPGLVGRLLGTGTTYTPYPNQGTGLLGQFLGDGTYYGGVPSGGGLVGRLFGNSVSYGNQSLGGSLVNSLLGF